jgi:hypothetical protein
MAKLPFHDCLLRLSYDIHHEDGIQHLSIIFLPEENLMCISDSHMLSMLCQIADMEKFTEYISDQELIMTDAISEPNKSQKKVQVLSC